MARGSYHLITFWMACGAKTRPTEMPSDAAWLHAVRRTDFQAMAVVFGTLESSAREHAAVVPLGARHLRRTVHNFVEHYHFERNHRGLNNALIVPAPPANDNAPIACRERLGRRLKYYYRRAA